MRFLLSPLLLILLIAVMAIPEPAQSQPNLAKTDRQSAGIESATKDQPPRYQLTRLSVLENAFNRRTSNIQVLVSGRVTAILADDNDGDRHQRFILQLANSQTLLVAHNIDIAPRVSGLQVGDVVYVYGEYEWNSQGGVLHWTHRDPSRRHVDGFIDHNGTVFR